VSGARRRATTPTLWPFAALSAGYFAHIGFFNPYLPLWLQERGFGLMAIGVLTAVPAGTRLFAPYAWGWLSDHTGERVRLLRLGALGALLLSVALWWPLGGVALFGVLLLMFSHTSGMMPMSEAVLAHQVSQAGGFDARRYGRVRLWGSLGFLVTVLAAGAWFERHGMGSFPVWTTLSLLVVLLSAWWLPDHREAPHHVEASGTSIAPVLRRPAVRWFFVALSFHVLSHIFVYIFLSLHLDRLGYGREAIGLFWAASVVIEVGWFFTQGRWLPRLSLQAWLVAVSVVMTLRMGLTAGAAGWWVTLLLAQALHALTFAAHHTVCIALLSQHFPGRLRGRGQALYSVIGYGLPGVVGGLVGGMVSQTWGLSEVFWLSAGCALVAAGCAWRLWGLVHGPHGGR